MHSAILIYHFCPSVRPIRCGIVCKQRHTSPNVFQPSIIHQKVKGHASRDRLTSWPTISCIRLWYLPNANAYELQTRCTDRIRRPASPTDVRGDLKGQRSRSSRDVVCFNKEVAHFGRSAT